jgi:C2 domain
MSYYPQGGYPPQQQGGYYQPQPPQQMGSYYPPQQAGYYPPAQGSYMAPQSAYGAMPAMGGMVPAQAGYAGGYGAAAAGGAMPQANAAGGRLLYEFQFKGSKLADKDLFSKSDPFLVMYASRSGRASSKAKGKDSGKKRGDWVAVHKTETIKNNLNPVWRPFQLDLYNVCGGRLDAPIMLEVSDWDRNGAHDLIGRATTSVRELQIMKEVVLVNPAHKNSMFRKGAGCLEVLKCAPVSAGATHVPATTVTTATTAYQTGGAGYGAMAPQHSAYGAPPQGSYYAPPAHQYPPAGSIYPPAPGGGYR